MVPLLLALACHGGGHDRFLGADGGDSASTGGDSGDSGETEVVPDLPTSECGLPAYEWLPLQGMGELVSVDEAEELSLTADALDALLGATELAHLTPVANGVRTFRVRYTTQDKGQPVEATALLHFPDLAERTDVPVMLWTHPTTGFMDECAPSAMGLVGAAWPILLASRGYAVAAPDYLGMAGFGAPSGQLHPWVVAEPTAVASLDAVRALLRFADEKGDSRDITGWPDPARTLVMGASEGGFAALWADRYQAAYLPEVTVVGVLASIPATDLRALGERAATHFGDTTAGMAAGIVTMHAWFEADAPLSEVLVPPLDTVAPDTLWSTCTDYGAAFDDIDTVEQVFTDDFRSAVTTDAELPPWTCFLDSATLRTSTIPRGSTAPVLIVTAENDDLAWPEPVHADIPALCAQGYEIEHVQCAGADHVGGAVQSLDYQLTWAARAAAGEALDTDCAVSAPIDCSTL